MGLRTVELMILLALLIEALTPARPKPLGTGPWVSLAKGGVEVYAVLGYLPSRSGAG